MKLEIKDFNIYKTQKSTMVRIQIGKEYIDLSPESAFKIGATLRKLAIEIDPLLWDKVKNELNLFYGV